MHQKPIYFYFDFVSVYAYFGALQIGKLAEKHKRVIEWRSILLGVTVMKKMGLKPLLETPLKGDYVRRDAGRFARKLRVPLTLPVSTELINPIPPARAFQWVKKHHPELAGQFALGLLCDYWGHGIDVSQAGAIISAADKIGLTGTEVLSGSASEQAKTLLRSEVDEAIKNGVFGSPFLLIDGEPFWGADKFDLVDEWLARGGW
jgi:2-hydroxychromene-2-carboxylate isomerase